jgi:hypothetical protein
VLLGLEYHAIVRWEEQLLESRVGQPYREYLSQVPRWLPKLARLGRLGERDNRADGAQRSSATNTSHETFSWGATAFSERGTLLAIAAGYLLLWFKLSL